MSMMCIKKHLGVLKGALLTLGVLTIITIASPFSVSFEQGESFSPNIAYAQTPCGLGDTQSTLPDGKIQCKGPLSTVIYNADGSKVRTGVDGTTLAVDAKGNVAVSTSCSSVLAFMASPFTCMFRTLVTLTAGALIYISTWVLSIAALLFNWLVDHTIIQFGTTYTDLVKKAVETAWTAFRDIANILIIGIFTFIAISIILGLKEYGQKRMIANVLIIAVLINFSLLGTKMIIDASNYTATQIYTAAALGSSTNGVADQFMYLLGVSTYGKALKLVDDTAEAKDSGWVALGHGILVMLVLLGAALVIFYGCFLLVSRMIMLIFLMITASIAFASYLIPKWAGSSYGWSAWWSSLLWCAAFAPILMLLLWMTLNVSYALKSTSKATLGAALSDPAGGGNIEALFMYLMVLGLLFGTFKISSMWANKIGGFDMAKALTSGPLAFATNFAWNRGRNLAQRGAGIWREGMQNDLTAAKSRAARVGGRIKDLVDKGQFDKLSPSSQRRLTSLALKTQAEADRYEQRSGSLEKFGKSGFNPLQTGVGKAVMKELGVPGMLMGGKSEGFGTKAEKIAKEAATRAEKAMLLTDKDKEKMRGESITEARKRHAAEKTTAEKQLEVTKTSLEAVRNQADYKGHEGNMEFAKAKMKDLERAHRAEISTMKASHASDDAMKTRMAEHKAELRTEEDKIETVRKEITRLEAPHAAKLSELESKLANYNDETKVASAIKALSDDVLKEWTAGSGVVAAKTAEQIAHRRSTNIIPRALQEDSKNDYTSRLARGLVEKNVREKNQGGDILKAIKAMTDATGGSTPPPAAPATGGHT